MATELQKRANRANALKSTGPQTDAGKAVVRLNATRHGLLSSAPVIAGEDADEYTAFCEQMQGDLNPVGILETQLAQRMAGALWRLRRLSHIEAGLLTGNAAECFAAAAESVAATHTRTEAGLDTLLHSMDGDCVVIENEAAHADATQAAKDARGVLWSVPALLGAAYRADATGADALTKLSRYETTLERSLFKTGEELAKLQATRREREARAVSIGTLARAALARRD